MKRAERAFTLVEILIVVVILGILAAMVVPQFVNATVEAEQKSAYHEVQKLRRAIEVYRVRTNTLPDVDPGDRTWGSLVLNDGQYLKDPPVNPYVGLNKGIIVYGAAPDLAYHTNYGWIYNPATGEVWAASFDANDTPYPKP